MKGKVLLMLLVAVAAGAGCRAKDEPRASATEKVRPVASHSQAKPPAPQPADDGHGHGQADEVPAFQTDAGELKSLKPTLSPALFKGRQKQGYEAAQAIPETIAQLPCYCHCDMSFGHKSLYTCFEDNHASQCAVCVNEALIAYNLHKGGMAPAQIREYIIQQYSKQQ